MTDKTQELAALQEQIALLKAQQEKTQLETTLEEAEKPEPQRKQERYEKAIARGEDFRQVKSSRVRCWGVALTHILLPPVASVVYANKTGKWAPTLVATGVAVIGVPAAVVDAGLTLGIVAPVTSAAMLINQVKEDRKRQQFIGPDEADMAYFSKF